MPFAIFCGVNFFAMLLLNYKCNTVKHKLGIDATQPSAPASWYKLVPAAHCLYPVIRQIGMNTFMVQWEFNRLKHDSKVVCQECHCGSISQSAGERK